MNRFVALVPLLLAVLAASTLRAATVNWTASTVAGPTDVSTAGTLVGAMNVGSATPQTVNGVTFAADPTGAGTLTLGSGTVAFGNLASTFNNFWTAADPGGDAAYAAALDTARWGTSGSGTVTLGGLTVGRTYLVQLWIADTRAGFDTRIRTVDGVATTSGGPNLATGAFIADAATQVITVDDGPNTFGPQVNLLQVRDVPFLVVNNADSGAGSLRQALADAATLSGADTITFAAALSGQTITLGSEIVVNGAGGVTVDATALAGGLTVNGGAGGNRIFSISSGPVTLAGLNLTGGDGGGATLNGQGGAILNRGTLTLTRCTLSGNSTAEGSGGAIANTATLTLRQCTVSGNSAGTFGGGLYNNGSAHLLHCTVAGNTASESGGGIYNDETRSLTLENSLVAGNSAGVSADIFNGGTLTRVGANRVQTTVGGMLAGTGTLTVADPLLAALAANNGPTPTHATSPASPARDAAVGSAITADQRGYPLFGTADIGAYEGQLGTIAAVTVNEDTATGALPFTVGTVGTLVATSGNTALVPNANLVLGGSGGSRTLTATPAAEASGTATLTVTDTVSGETTACVLTVTAVNDPPTDLALSATTVAENQPANTMVGTLSGTDPDAGQSATLAFSLVSGTGSTDNAHFNVSGTTLRTSSSFNFEAKSSYAIRLRATDTGGQTYEEAVIVTVANVNEVPTDLALSATTVAENQPANTMVGTLSGTDPDAGQSATLAFSLVSGTGSTDNAHFNVSGTTLRTSSSFNFEAKSSYAIRLRATDTGGLLYEEAVTITVTDVNDPPTLSAPVNQSIAVNTTAGPLAFTVGDVDTDVASLTLTAASSNPALVPVANVVFGGSGANRTVTVTPAANQFGTATLTVTVSDGALTAQDTFELTVLAPDLALERTAGTDLLTGGSVDLGSVALGASGTAQTFTLRNVGSLDLTGLALTVDGAMPGDFAVSAPGATTLAPDASTTFTITFTPGGPDFRTARLVVASNDPDENPFTLRLTGTGASAAPLALAQRAYAKPSNTGVDDWFGISVAVSGDTVVVGAPGEDSNAIGVNGNRANNSASASGAAYVFVRSSATWTQQAYLKASNTGESHRFGRSVAVSGDTVVVGAHREDGIALNSGAAYVFVRSGSTWTQQAYLKASNTGAGDEFGFSVAVSGDTVVVGAPNEDSNTTGVNGNGANNSASASGAAYVFVRSSATWTQQAYLKASNTGGDDQFGSSVAVSGDTVVVGAPVENSNATGVNGNGANNSASASGAAYVFVRSGSAWVQQAYLKASNTEAGDQFGFSVAVSGDTVVVGADLEDSNAIGVNGDGANDSAFNAGAAYVFLRSGTTWTQQAYLKASNTGGVDQFGSSVAVSGDTVVVGAKLENSIATGVDGNRADDSAFNAGAAYVFVRSGSTWTQRAYLKASNTEAGDEFGYSVAVSGDTVVVGADFEDSNAIGVNGNGSNNSAGNAGAAYVFVPSAPPTDLALSATTVAENQPAATVVGTLSGTDPDFGPLTFSLVSGTGDTDNARFTVAGTELRTAAPFDFETQSLFSLRLRVTDPTGLAYEEVVTVTVTDVNDAPTDLALSATSVAENQPVDTVVGTLSGTDPDAGQSATLIFSLVSGAGDTDNARFTVSGTELRTAESFNFESRSSFSLRLRATDTGGLSYEEAVTLTVTDVNDVPRFTKGADQSIGPGTTAAQTVPGWATAISDGDGGGQVLTFTVTETGSSGLFTVPPAVAADGTLTYTPNGTVGTATFSVTLTDDATRGGPALTSAPQTFTVGVAIDYTVTTSGGVLTVTELTGGDNTLTLTQPSEGNLQFDAPGRSFSVNGGPALTGSSGSVSLAGITEVVVNAGAGNDTLHVGTGSGNHFTAFPSLTLNGGTGDDSVNFNRDVTFVAGASLDVDLQNDAPAPGVDQVTVANSRLVTLSGPGTATVKVSRNITVSSSARVETADGALLLEANRQAVPTVADFSGITVQFSATVRSTGTGSVTLRGTGGAGSGDRNYGITCEGTVTSTGTGTVTLGGTGGAGSGDRNHGIACAGTVTSGGGDVTLNGQGGGTGASFFNPGVIINHGLVSAGGAGRVTVEGMGGPGDGNQNMGVVVQGVLTSGGGNVIVTGQGGSGSGSQNFGIAVERTVTSGGGDVLLTGVGGGGTSPIGIVVQGFGTVSTAANGGTLTLVSDSMLLSSGTLSTRLSDSVTLRPLTAGRLVDLGSFSDGAANTLGLSDDELDQITTGTLVIGDATSGPITVSAALSPANYKVLALGQNTTFAAAGQFNADIGPTAADYERLTVTGTVTLDPAAQLNLTASGGYVPQAGDAFTLLANDGSDAIGGTFTGKPEGFTAANFLGSGAEGLFSYLGGDGNDLVVTAPNTAPLAGADSLERAPRRALRIPVATLLANDSSPLGLPLSIVAVPAASTGGVPLLLAGGVVFYQAPGSLAATDTFTYTVGDGTRTATGTVTVTVRPESEAPTQNILATALVGDAMQVTAAGIPGRSYRLQRAPSLASPVTWSDLGAPVAADALGQLVLTDPVPVSPGFYRVIETAAP